MNVRAFWHWLTGKADHDAAAREKPMIAERLKASDNAVARADRAASKALAEVRRLERLPK